MCAKTYLRFYRDFGYRIATIAAIELGYTHKDIAKWTKELKGQL